MTLCFSSGSTPIRISNTFSRHFPAAHRITAFSSCGGGFFFPEEGAAPAPEGALALFHSKKTLHFSRGPISTTGFTRNCSKFPSLHEENTLCAVGNRTGSTAAPVRGASSSQHTHHQKTAQPLREQRNFQRTDFITITTGDKIHNHNHRHGINHFGTIANPNTIFNPDTVDVAKI